MKIELTTDQFAEFMAKIIFRIDVYQYDVFYAIATIMEEHNKHRGKSDKPIYDVFHLMIRDTGCDLVRPNDKSYKIYEKRSNRIYILKFCWNRDYFNVPFCYMSQV